jgi:hypothetical protein
MSMVNPDSVLARTAAELRIAHIVDPLGSGESCRRCGRQYPCAPARLAAEVCQAAGLPEELEDERPVDGQLPAGRTAA